MGLKNRDSSRKYLRVKNGKFYIGKDTDKSYEELEGLITELRYKDEEYEGQPQRKLIVTLEDEGERYQLGVNVESSTYSSLVSFLANMDLTKPVTLHPKEDMLNKDGKEITRRSMLVSQDGKFAKSYFTKDAKHGLPEWKVVVVGKKKVTDKSDYTAFLEKFVNEKLTTRLAKPVAVKTEKSNSFDPEELEEASAESIDRLPWED